MDNPDQPDKILLPLGPPANNAEIPRQDGACGRISKKSLQRERLILALLEQPSYAKAAASIGISYVTAWRISKTPEFQQEYLAARRQSMTQTSARMQHASGPSVSTLIKLMLGKDAYKDVPYAIQLRAAESILHHAESGLQLEDMDARLKLLEQKNKREARKLE